MDQNINEMLDAVRQYEKHGLNVNDIEQIASKALVESYRCTDSYQGVLMYLMAIEILSQGYGE